MLLWLTQVADLVWNEWPASCGITVRNGVEWVSGFLWIHCPEWRGIRKVAMFSAYWPLCEAECLS